MVVQQQRKQLKIDKRLPQILIPPKTRVMFMNWWNKDIRFEKSIPHSFEKGYMVMDYNYLDIQDELLKTKTSEIKEIAHHYHCTYRNAEEMFKNMLFCFSKLTLYFEFIAENALRIEIYDNTNQLISNMEFAVGDSEPEPEIVSDDILFKYGMKQLTYPDKPGVVKVKEEDMDNQEYFYESMQCLLCFIVTAFWYISTTKSTKYIYENKTPMVVGRKRNVVKVSDTKTITTPIYDMNKVRVVKVEHLQKRKAGWTYSHSFQVHGHYRHYRSGKVIFVKEFTKGKNKEFKAQQIVLDPKHK